MQDAYVIVLLHYQSAAYPSHPIVALVVIGQIEGIFCHGGRGSRGHSEPFEFFHLPRQKFLALPLLPFI